MHFVITYSIVGVIIVVLVAAWGAKSMWSDVKSRLAYDAVNRLLDWGRPSCTVERVERVPTTTGWCYDRTLGPDQVRHDKRPDGAAELAILRAGQWSSDYYFEITGARHKTERVTSIHVYILAEASSPSGTAYFITPQGITPRQNIGFDLTQPNQSNIYDAYVVAGGDTSTTDPYPHSSGIFTLDHGEQIPFLVRVAAPKDRDITFRIEMRFATGDSIRIPGESEEPFRITTPPNDVNRAYTTRIGPNGGTAAECRWPDGCARDLLTEIE